MLIHEKTSSRESFCIFSRMKNKLNALLKISLDYFKSFNWVILVGIAVFCIVLAIVNNIRVSDDKSVDWIGTQDVMEKPADIL